MKKMLFAMFFLLGLMAVTAGRNSLAYALDDSTTQPPVTDGDTVPANDPSSGGGTTTTTDLDGTATDPLAGTTGQDDGAKP